MQYSEMVPLSLGGTKKRTLRSKRQQQEEQEEQEDEERVSLVDPLGAPTAASGRRRSHPTTTTSNTSTVPNQKKKKNGNKNKKKIKWTPTRLMRYLSLTVFSALFTFFFMRRESKSLHWQEFNHLLQPELKKGQAQCYSERRHGQNERCTCPDPSVPLAGTSPVWKTHHDQMVLDAKHAPSNLDIVFVGDAIVERWQGTTDLGVNVLAPDMKQPFQARFVKKNGAELEGLALGASSDTGPNLLWHIQNGMIDNLNPKLWFISIGSNDLFEEKCTDRFVVASILNVIKAIADLKPEAHIIVHGILPRKDDAKAKTDFLKKKWKYAQNINTQIRKFCEHSTKLFYMQAGPLFLKGMTEEWKGRRTIDKKLLEDGMHPTKRGMEVWGDYIVKRVKQILQDIQEQKTHGINEQSRFYR